MASQNDSIAHNNMLLKERVKNVLEKLNIENGNFQDFEAINNRLSNN
jgi:hypothetical protein